MAKPSKRKDTDAFREIRDRDKRALDLMKSKGWTFWQAWAVLAEIDAQEQEKQFQLTSPK